MKQEPIPLISSNLKYLRRVSGLTQGQLAQRIDTKRANIGAYEEARATPPVEMIKTIAKVFGVSVDDFVNTDIQQIRESALLTLGFETGVVNDAAQDAKPDSVAKSGEEVQKNTRMPESAENSVTELTNAIQLVRRPQFNDYLMKHRDAHFLKTLPLFHLPTLPLGEYRAFEAADDFAFEGALLIGSIIDDLYDIADGKNYVLVTKMQGIVYRRVYNQIKIKRTLLLSSDNPRFPSTEISVGDVLEVWEVKSFVSNTLPEPHISFDKLNHLVDELKFELERLKK